MNGRGEKNLIKQLGHGVSHDVLNLLYNIR